MTTTFEINKNAVSNRLEQAQSELEVIKTKLETIASELTYYENEKESLNALIEYFDTQEKRAKLCLESPFQFGDEYGIPLSADPLYIKHAKDRLEQAETEMTHLESKQKTREEIKSFLENDIKLLKSMLKVDFRSKYIEYASRNI